MNQRLQQFLNAENLSQSQFADEINVARASVSHILANRNKPGFDFIESMAKAFPALNLEWLITGKGRMYKSQEAIQPAADVQKLEQQPVIQEDALFEIPAETPLPTTHNERQSQSDAMDRAVKKDQVIESTTSADCIKSTANKREISKIVVYFSDSTYQEFIPGK